MSKLSAVLKPSLYCSLALCFLLSQSINQQTQAEDTNESATFTKAEKPHRPSAGKSTEIDTGNKASTRTGAGANTATGKRIPANPGKSSSKPSTKNDSSLSGALKLGPAKPLALPKINTPPNFATPPSNKTYKYLDATSCANEDDIVINTDDTIATYKAKSQEVAVNGNGCKIAIAGKCSSLVINGSNNIVKLETVSEIVANGDRNQVRWLEGATTGKPPVIADNGSNNDIAKISKPPKAL